MIYAFGRLPVALAAAAALTLNPLAALAQTPAPAAEELSFQEVVAQAAAEDPTDADQDAAEETPSGDTAEDETPAGDESGSEEGPAEDEGPAADDDGAADPDEDDEDPVPAGPGYTGWVGAHGEPCSAAHAVGWVDYGVRAESKFFYDPATDAWYWTEADGSLSRDHDAFVPLDNTVAGDAWEDATTEWRMANGKWVRLGADGRMVKGEDYRGGEWYLFDEVTGAMQYGFKLLPDGQGGSKWVFYDYVTGQMAHGERCIDGSHGDEPGWMYFDPATGAVDYGWAWLPDSGKWVYYNEVSGRMMYGSLMIDGKPYFLDPVTGARLSRTDVVNRLLDVCASQNGVVNGSAYHNFVISRGGTYNHWGCCTSFISWCFNQAGLTYQWLDGSVTSYPNVAHDWFVEKGRTGDWFANDGSEQNTPRPGDIWFVDQPAYRSWAGASQGTHAGIIAAVDPDGQHCWAWEHVNGYVHLVHEDLYVPEGTVMTFGRPYYNE